MKFKKGNRVIFVKNKNYILGMSNPMVGSRWFCEGVVVHGGPGSIRVLWDNGRHNDYDPECLECIDCFLPGELFEI